MTQYHFLDDSGDPGLSGTEGSSSYFVLAMVQLGERASLFELATIRHILHFPPEFEFKYHSAKPRQKTIFFETIQPIRLRVRAAVINKLALTLPTTKIRGSEIAVDFIARLALRAPEQEIARDVLIIDDGTPAFCRALRVRLSAECRKADRIQPFQKIVGSRTKNEDGLQLADMIAGAIRQYATRDEKIYYETFASKVVDLWRVP